ncbi:uncharacterized protein ACBR49_002087 isoform 2-T2 [Aulostomus maculatus]
MSSLSRKSAQEISEMLDEYGIKHGPVVDSTRSLYEKKLKEAMAREERPSPSSDKTYYREEEEEVTYVYRTPVRSDGSADRPYMRSRPEWTEREFEPEPHMYDMPSTYRNSYLKSTPMKSPQAPPPAAPKSARFVPLWVQFIFFLAVAAFLYFVFSNMETNEYTKKIE